MKAIILSAGYGTRMKPYTKKKQKTMLKVHEKPILEYLIEGIKSAGIKYFVIVVGYKKEQIKQYFKDGESWDINIEYVEQNKLNGTGGALLICEDLINERNFFLTWGDVIMPYTIYQEVLSVYKKKGENFVLVANYVEDPYKGAAIYSEDGYLTDLIEKPPKGESESHFNNSGIFILSTEIFNVLKEVEPSNRGEIEVPRAIQKGVKENGWNVRVIKTDRLRADFGDKKVYEKLRSNKNWLEKLKM